MEWQVLIFLLPLVLVPVVMLLAFAGCDRVFGLEAPEVLAPNILSAVATGLASVRVTWDNPNSGATTFELNRTKDGDSTSTTIQTPDTTFDDQGLEQGTTYFYTVTAIQGGERSPASAMAQATTLGTAFTGTLTQNRNEQGNCIVQRIEPPRLSRGGTQVVLTVQGSTNQNLVIDQIYISQVTSGGDPYDPAGDLRQVASAVFVAQGTSVTLPQVAYTLDPAQPLLVAFDIGSPGGVRHEPNVPSGEGAAFVFAAPGAALPDRPTGVAPIDRIYLVVRIDVV